MENACIMPCKRYIDNNNLDALKELWAEYSSADNASKVAWDVVFKGVYIHACMKKRKDIVTWLDTLYQTFDPIQQIGLRTVFPYARYLMKK
jgi:hypothetical protein